MKLGVSLPCSQELATEAYSELFEFSPHPHFLFLKINFNIILPSASRCLVAFLWLATKTCVRIFHLFHASCMLLPAYPP